ncbi:MAG: metal ABC transporter substrate-binding protein [Hyphomonadaceae bacterium]|nr:metal ABC transporter substrate-binding protein [Hyphomonadaceae bacterium]
MHARAFALALAAVIAAAPAPRASSQDKIRVVTTSADLKSLVEAVGGDRLEVESLTAPEQDPHTVEIKPTQLARLRGAALIVRIGLDHEPWFARLPVPRVPVVDASRSVRLLQTQTPRLRAERQAHVHAFGNTHYWLDPHNARPITQAVLAALTALRPDEAAAFEANRNAFLSRLDARISAWEQALKRLYGARIVVVHDSWAYFAERFGLQIVAAAEPHPGISPSPAELAALFKRMRDSNVRILIADPHANPALVQQIKERGGARSVTLLPSAPDYVALFEENVRRLSASLGPD